MSDQFVQLPSNVLGASQKYDASNLLATISRFSLGSNGQNTGNQLERDLDLRFASLSSIGFADATSYFTSAGIKTQALDSQVADLANGNPESLHQALQTGNNAQNLQLLAISDASKLIELEDTGEASPTPRPLWSKAETCLLLRLGYSPDQNYGYYAASLPGDSRRPIKLTWDSVVAAGVTNAVAILPAAKPVDLDRAATAMHIIDQARTTLANAIADLLDAMGQQQTPDSSTVSTSQQAAPTISVPAEQAV